MVSLSANLSHQDRVIRQMEADGSRHALVDLVCVTDGRKVQFLDDGPWRVATGLPPGETTPHNPGRQRLLQAVKKRDRDGHPVWFSEKPGVRVFDFAINEFREVPCTSEPRYEQLKAAHKVIRDERMAAGARHHEALRKEAQAEANAKDEATLVRTLGKLLNKAEEQATPAKNEPKHAAPKKAQDGAQ